MIVEAGWDLTVEWTTAHTTRVRNGKDDGGEEADCAGDVAVGKERNRSMCFFLQNELRETHMKPERGFMLRFSMQSVPS